MSGAGGYFRPPPPRVLAHRGLALDAPENTLLSFLAALARGATHLEIDVHASLDGIAMISHDADLQRVAGRAVRVDQLTASELQRVDLGRRQGFPTLAEALDAFPDARFNIDIKAADAVLPTVEAIRRARATHRVLVTSFDGRRSRGAVRMLPGVATSASGVGIALLIVALALHVRPAVGRVLRDIQAVQIPERSYGIRILTPRLIRAAHRAGVEVHVWTVNDRDDIRRLFTEGVDGVVSDRADLALEVLAERVLS